MYKKSYIHLTECMLSDNEKLFSYQIVCNDENKFKKMVTQKGYKELNKIDSYGYPITKIYNSNNEHICSYDLSQGIIFSSLPL